VLRRVVPAVPAPLAAVVFGIVAVHALGLQHHGVAIVGHIDGGLPSFGFPGVPSGDYLKLVSLGSANLAAGLSAGMVVNGSLSKTAVNGGADARTQMSGLITAALTDITLLFLTGLFQDLPEATLGAVVIAALTDLVDIASLRELYRASTGRLAAIYGHAARADFIASVAALFGVLVFDTLPGLFSGITVSILLLVYRSSRPHVAALGRAPGSAQWTDIEHNPQDTTVPSTAVPRVESGIYFANADHVRIAIEDAASRPGGHRGRAGLPDRPGHRRHHRPDAGRTRRPAGRPRHPAGHRARHRPGPRHPHRHPPVRRTRSRAVPDRT
jgi:MFS superfamily sulfate permease-like transporter